MLKVNDLLCKGKLAYNHILKYYDDLLEDDLLYRNYYEEAESLKAIIDVPCSVLEYQHVMEWYDKCMTLLIDIALNGGTYVFR